MPTSSPEREGVAGAAVLELLAWIAAFYAWQCLQLPPGHAAVLAFVAGTARWRPGGTVVVASPWPGDWTVPLAPLPIEIGSEHLYARDAAAALRVGARPPAAVPLAAIANVDAAGEWLCVNGRRFARCGSRTQARSVAALVAELRAAEPAARLSILRAYVDRSLSPPRLRALLPEVRQAVRPLSAVCSLLLLGVFAVLPIGAARGFSPGQWLAAGGLLGALFAAALVLLARARRALPPGAPSGWDLVLPLALFPPALLRAPDVVWREALADFHPLLIAGEWLARDAWVPLLRRELARLAYPDWRRDADADDPGRAAGAAIEREALLVLARALELPPDALTLAAPAGSDAVSYCPACLDEFRPGFSRCQACDVETVAFGGRANS